MKRLYQLILQIIASLTFTWKFVIICLLFFCLSFAYLTQISKTQNLQMTELSAEIEQLAFDEALLDLRLAIVRHQRISHEELLGNTSLSELKTYQENLISNDLKELSEVIKGDPLSTNSEKSTIEKIANSWNSFIENPSKNPQESLQRHLELLQELHLVTLQHKSRSLGGNLIDPSIALYKHSLYLLLPNFERALLSLGDFKKESEDTSKATQTEEKIAQPSAENAKATITNAENAKTTLTFNQPSKPQIDKTRILLEGIKEDLSNPNISEDTSGLGLFSNLDVLNSRVSNYLALLEADKPDVDKIQSESNLTLDALDTYKKSLFSHYSLKLHSLKNSIQFQLWKDKAFFISYTSCLLLIAFFILRSILNPLKIFFKTMQNFTAGDLEARIPLRANKELSQMATVFNTMADSVEQLIINLQHICVHLASGTTEITAAVKRQENSLQSQADSAKIVTSSSKDISTTIQTIATSIHQATKSAEFTSALALKGQTSVEDMKKLMENMSGSAQQVRVDLDRLNHRATSITRTTTALTHIADRANLLALNAAIESHKLGQDGGSFWVIANEVKRLSEQVANIILENEREIGAIIEGISTTINAMIHFVEEIANGVKHTQGADALFQQIIIQVQKQKVAFATLNDKITSQSSATQQITHSLDQLSSQTQESTESIHEFQNTLKGISKTIQDLQIQIVQTKLSPTKKLREHHVKPKTANQTLP
ncbi:MAG: methyl-accepting chemotaxis protein [Chlamydiia bacterium]|nr:methyl-accepting chemotaxis protein [Chlamydiia bacterium]